MEIQELKDRVKALAGKVEQRTLEHKAQIKQESEIFNHLRDLIDDLPDDPMQVINTASQEPKTFLSGKYKRYELNRHKDGYDIQLVVYENALDFGIHKAWYAVFDDELNVVYRRDLV